MISETVRLLLLPPTVSFFFVLKHMFTFLFEVAVIKYWGKADVKLNTPVNSSASITLDQVHTISNIKPDLF